MIQSLRFQFLLIAVMFITTVAKSQSDKFAYTVTDSLQNGVKWQFLRKIDLRTGVFGSILLRLLNSNDTVANSALCNGVAAMGLDNRNRRLYFTPMLKDRLSYVDLRTMRIHVVTNHFTGLMPKAADQSNIITRMVIADDNKGYALTNDGKHLIRFNTRNHQITDLGSLVNARHNEVSVHEVCSSFGGDIISGDDDDILYLVTSQNHVFKIKIETRVAKYLGTISGLSESFTTSGAAVDFRDNRVVIGSAIDASHIYSVDFKTLVANKLNTTINSWHSADLANGNNLKKKKHDDDDDDDRGIFVNSGNKGVDIIQIYPNPVTSNRFTIQFTDTKAGSYTVNVIDVLGKTIKTGVVNILNKNNTAVINLPELTAKGIYIVKITDKANKTIFSEKIILQ